MGMDENEIKKKSGMTEGDDIAHGVDDLDEGAEALLDEYAEDQEWESYDSEEDEDTEEPAPRRKKGLFSFNTIVIVIAVVFGGAFIAMQLSKNAPKQQQVAQRQQVSPTGLQMVGQKERQAFNQINDPAAVPGLPPEPAAEGARQGAGLSLPEEENMPPMPGVLDFGEGEKVANSPSPDALPEPGVMSGEPVPAVADPRVGGASASVDAVPSGFDLPAEGSGKVSGDVLTPMPDLSGEDKKIAFPEKSEKDAGDVAADGENALPLPKADAIFKAAEKKGEMPSSPVRKVETQNLDGVFPDTAGPSAAEIADSKARSDSESISAADVSNLEVRLSELGGRLDRLEQKIGKTSGAAQSAQESGEIRDLKETVKRLEAKLSGLSSATAAPAASSVSGKKPVRKESEKKVRSSSVAVSSKPRASATKAAGPSLTAQRAPALEIRAAQPGRAWVARPGDNDLQSVSVGDSLPGVGRVTSIAQVGGRWIVEGTKGRLSQ